MARRGCDGSQIVTSGYCSKVSATSSNNKVIVYMRAASNNIHEKQNLIFYNIHENLNYNVMVNTKMLNYIVLH